MRYAIRIENEGVVAWFGTLREARINAIEINSQTGCVVWIENKLGDVIELFWK